MNLLIKSRAHQLSLLLILALHAYFKLFHVEFLLYGDEAFSVFHAQKSVTELLAVLNNEANPPLFYLMLNGWINLFGTNAMTVKALPVIFSMISAIGIYLLSVKHINYRGAVLNSILFLCSNLHFDFSHEIRAFSMVSMLTIWSFYCFIELLHNPQSKRLLIIYGFLTLCLPYAHYNAALVPIVQCLLLIILKFKKVIDYKPLFIAYGAAFLAFIPQLIVFSKNIPDENFWLAQPGTANLTYVFSELSGNIKWMPYLYGFTAILSIAAMSPLRKKLFHEKFNLNHFTIFLSWFILPVMLNYLIAQFTPAFRLRYVLFASVGFYFTFVYCLSLLKVGRLINDGLTLFFAFTFILPFSPENRYVEDWENTVDIIKKEKDEGTLILLSAWYKYVDFSYYYSREVFEDYKNTLKKLYKENIIAVNDWQDLSSAKEIEQYQKVILVLSHNEVVDPNATLLNNFISDKWQQCFRYGSDIGVKVYQFTDTTLTCNESSIGSPSKNVIIDCNEWSRQALIKNDETGILYKIKKTNTQNCEGHMKWQNDRLAIGPKNPFSPAIILEPVALDHLNIQMAIEKTDYRDAMFVVSLEEKTDRWSFGGKQKSVLRKEFSLNNVIQSDTGKVLKVDFSVNVNKEIPEHTELRIYFWNFGGSDIQMIDFSAALMGLELKDDAIMP